MSTKFVSQASAAVAATALLFTGAASGADRPKAKPLPSPLAGEAAAGPVKVCPHLDGKDAAFLLAFDDGCEIGRAHV